MNTPIPAFEKKEDLQKKLQWLMFSRVIVASFFLGVAIIAQIQRSASYLEPYLIYLYGLTASVYLLTFIYISLIVTLKNLKLFCYSQIMIDIMLISALIFITGGVNSMFPSMYSISIIAASILLYRTGAIIIATGASVCYCLLLTLQYNKIIYPLQLSAFIPSRYAEDPLMYPLIINITSFYLVALLSSFVSEQARKSRIQLNESQVDIRTLEALNEHIIQSINSGLITLDQEARIIMFNRAAEEITGLSSSSVHNRHIDEIFPPGIAHYIYAANRDNHSLKSRFELSFIREDERLLRFGFSSSALKDGNDHEIGKILVFQDLTALKEMEDRVKKMDRLAAIGRLAAGIAHEVRNPLASISGSVQVLQKSLQLSDNDKRLMDIVLSESNNLNHLISNFVQYARPHSQKKELIHLKNLVDETLQLFQNSPECSGNLTIRQDIEDICFEADPQQLKQVVWNLLINAAQAINSDAGQIVIAAHYTRSRPELFDRLKNQVSDKNTVSRNVELVVQDNGCGIDDRDHDKIFEPFYTTKDSGTGLGLSIVYRIVEDFGGTISVKSVNGEGTCFTVCIPA